jgi:hypothetical protein
MAKNNSDKHVEAPRSHQKSALKNFQNQENMNTQKGAQGADKAYKERPL